MHYVYFLELSNNKISSCTSNCANPATPIGSAALSTCAPNCAKASLGKKASVDKKLRVASRRIAHENYSEGVSFEARRA